MKKYFIAGAGTDVGKTFCTALLTWQLRKKHKRVVALKPVISGFDAQDATHSDTAELLAAQELALSQENIERISPWRFAKPLSPDMAAQAEGKTIELHAVVTFCNTVRECDYLLIESAGGIMSPLNKTQTMLDWAAALGAPVIMVAGSYLGALSHTLAACNALASQNVPLHGVIICESAASSVTLEQTRASLQHFLPTHVALHGIARLDSSPEIWKYAPSLLPLVL